MGYKRRTSHIAGNVISPSLSHFFTPPAKTLSGLTVVSCSSKYSMKRAMSCIQKNQLWNPRLGIRFSAKRDPKPLYPQLDVSRFLHIPSLNSQESHGETELLPNYTGVHDPRKISGNLLSDPQEDRIASISSNLHPTDSKAVPEDIEEEGIAAAEGEAESNLPEKEEIVEPPWTPLSFNISSELFHAARASAAGSADSYWSHTMYQKVGEDGSIEKVKVHYCTSKSTMESVCTKYFLGESVLGLDLEWFSFATRDDGPRQNVSLIQIASPSRIALFHVALFPKGDDFVAPTFRQMMEDPDVSKVGVHISGDCRRLKNYLGVGVRGVFELSHLYKVVKFLPEKHRKLINKVPVALAQQVQEHLRLPLYKGQTVRSSNWAKALNSKQLEYSAADAYAGIQLYYVLEEKRKALDPCPPRPFHAELGLPIPLPEPEEEVNDEDDMTDATTSKKRARSKSSKSASKSKTSKTKSSTASSKSKARTSSSSSALDPRITAAEHEMAQYRSSKTTYMRTTPSALRVYYIWHGNDDLDPEGIAKLLRDPPLKTNTVVSYILTTIIGEKLPYSRLRLKTELLSLINPKLAGDVRYKSLFEDCQGI